MLDTLKVERERGITVKAQTASGWWRAHDDDDDGGDRRYLLNLVDTPGHVDFSCTPTHVYVKTNTDRMAHR